MINFIARYFSSLWSLISAPFRGLWLMITRIFPPREFTVMETPSARVYTFYQNSFWRFTKFCGKFGLIIWASWSTYVFVYHRPMLQKRTQQLEYERSQHARHMTDLQIYLKKYNDLTREINIIDDKILTEQKHEIDKEKYINERLKIWGELDFLHNRITNMFTNENYSAEYQKLSDLNLEIDLVKNDNKTLQQEHEILKEQLLLVSEADQQIIDSVSKISNEQITLLQSNLHKINSVIKTLGISNDDLIKRANKYSNNILGASFDPIVINAKLNPKYQKLADQIELWSGLKRLNTILPIGIPVKELRITSKYGIRNDPFTHEKKQHKGVDFGGKIGTELTSVAPGRVISAGERIGYGTTVEIDHGLGFTTLYAHLSRVLVSRGDWIQSGTVIGLGGSSGRSTGPHLHYEIKYKGKSFDPIQFVKE